MTVVFGLGTKLRVRMRTTLENGVLRNRQQPGRAENSFIDQDKFVAIERLRVTSQGVWLPLILMLQSCKLFKVILEAQVTQICTMDILRLTIDFIKMSEVWSLCMEFYGAWQELHTEGPNFEHF